MSMNKFKALVKVKWQEGASNYLMKSRGSKGSEIFYPEVEMAEYVMPYTVLNGPK